MHIFSLEPLRGHCARGAQHTGHHGWCHGWNRFHAQKIGKGYIQWFFTQLYRNFRGELFVKKPPVPPNFHLDTIGGIMPEVYAHWAWCPMVYCRIVQLAEVRTHFKSFSLYPFVNVCTVQNPQKKHLFHQFST